ncbi:unnamed protein product, partial [Brugia pahangi]|uniref:Fibronectin type-II domain-containing protein n=1 Tax=Brugia pahangi TaxID=6280 RepID=A0A0N4TWB3_BRUPA
QSRIEAEYGRESHAGEEHGSQSRIEAEHGRESVAGDKYESDSDVGGMYGSEVSAASEYASDNSASDEHAGDSSTRGKFTKGGFVESDGRRKECFSAEACYDQREPEAWCTLNENQSWTDKGCFCDTHLHSCVIERWNSGRLEYSYCVPEEGWKCS